MLKNWFHHDKETIVDISDFDFLITYGVCKKRKYCNRMIAKKKFSFWWMFMFGMP